MIYREASKFPKTTNRQIKWNFKLPKILRSERIPLVGSSRLLIRALRTEDSNWLMLLTTANGINGIEQPNLHKILIFPLPTLKNVYMRLE